MHPALNFAVRMDERPTDDGSVVQRYDNGVFHITLESGPSRILLATSEGQASGFLEAIRSGIITQFGFLSETSLYTKDNDVRVEYGDNPILPDPRRGWVRMVYRISSRYGYELDRGHIKDFLATVGIGLTSQVFEGYARRLIGGVARGRELDAVGQHLHPPGAGPHRLGDRLGQPQPYKALFGVYYYRGDALFLDK